MSRPAPHVGFVIGGLLVLQIATTMALNAPTVLGPVMLADFGLAPRLLGFFVAVLLGGAMVSSLLAGVVVRRLGPLRASQAGALLMALAMLCAASGWPALLLIAIVLMGFGVGPITPSSSQLLAQVTPAHRMGLAFSVRQAGLPVGIAVMGVLVPALLLVMNWQGALVVLAAIVGSLALALHALRRAVPAAVAGPMSAATPAARGSVLSGLLRPIADVWRQPRLRRLVCYIFSFGFIHSAGTVYIVSYLALELHFSLVAAGTLFAVMQVSSAVTRIGWGWLTDRLRDPYLVWGGLGVGSAVFMVLFAMVGPDWPVWLVAAIMVLGGATLAGWNGIPFAAVALEVPHAAVSSTTGAMQSVGFLGALVGPPAFALVISLFGMYSRGYLLFALLVLVLGLVVAISRAGPGARDAA
jgi:MFS family permease